MGTKAWIGKVGIALLATLGAGCDEGSGPHYRFQVGDRVDGGKVTEVERGGGCEIITVSIDPEWECSAELLNGGTMGAATPLPASASPALPGVVDPAKVSLIPTDCEGLAALRRPALKSAQRSALEQGRRIITQDKCVGKTSVKYFQGGESVPYCSQPPTYSPPYASGTGGGASIGQPGGLPSPPANVPTLDSGAPEDGAKEYSTTNNQVAGVDEADFVKNDAEHVYVLSPAGLHVIDAWPAPETKEVKLLPLPGVPRRLFLSGDKLVVYTQMGTSVAGATSDQGCTYGYDCRFSAEPGQTMVIVFDVSEPSAPVELKRFAFSGGYVASRRVGSSVYTVVQDGNSTSLPGIDLTLEADSPEEFTARYAERVKQADDAVDSAPASSFLPWVRTLEAASNVEQDASSCDNALAAQAAQGLSFVSLVSFDLDTLGDPTRTLIAGKPGYVYASAGALYLATDGADGGDFIAHATEAGTDYSTVHKFALDGLNTGYRGSAIVPGHVLNQFSMDELDGVLRVATSSGWVPSPSVNSNLVTLSEQAGTFAQLGNIGGIAPTEDIRSVRFDGTRAFVVTFKKTDPLFVFDLTTPAQPRMLGELKIPGFSTYMHPMDQNHLLAVGFDADDHGDFAYFDGIQLQIFDVSDLANPMLLHKTTVGTRGSASEGLTNHLAFNYFPSKGMLALPMSVCTGGDDGVYGDALTFSGLMVFDVSLEQGIKEHGRMPFVNTASVVAQYGAGFSCNNWWASGTSDVKRSIFMDDYAIGISDTQYQVAPLASLSDVLESVPLGKN